MVKVALSLSLDKILNGYHESQAGDALLSECLGAHIKLAQRVVIAFKVTLVLPVWHVSLLARGISGGSG